jgi:DNA polymerase
MPLMARRGSDRQTIDDILRFYVEAGVDAALSETSVDAFALSRTEAEAAARRRVASRGMGPPAAQRREAAAAPPSVAALVTAPSGAAIMAAREAAAGAATLDELRNALAGFEGCNLRLTATKLVFADGNPQARVMFVGEAPGSEEDLQGLPFVGKSGQLLDRMLAAIGLDRSTAYIANVIPWRPPGNREPTPQETEICRPFVARQIALVDPDFLVLLGKRSAQTLFDTATPITKLRGEWRHYDTGLRRIRATATFHPAHLLRQPAQKRFAWRDLLALKKAMDEPRPPTSSHR